jgi:hypothetical protein
MIRYIAEKHNLLADMLSRQFEDKPSSVKAKVSSNCAEPLHNLDAVNDRDNNAAFSAV